MAEAFGIACHELVSLDFRCGSRLCKNAYGFFCVARLWVWMICRDGFSGFVDFCGPCGPIGRLVPL